MEEDYLLLLFMIKTVDPTKAKMPKIVGIEIPKITVLLGGLEVAYGGVEL